MIDFVLAMIAAGVNSAGNDEGNSTAALVVPQPAQEEVVETPVAPASPTVSIGQNVSIGEGVTVGGGTTQSGGASSLLDGTAEEIQPTTTVDTAVVTAPETPEAPADSGFNMAVVPAGLVAEDQTPSGKFTTATEVKPILGATKGNWVAVREYDGKDLLYVTHLWGWRCGLAAMAISINDEPMQNWPLPPCHMEYSTPNAVLEEDGLPYLTLRLKSVEKIDIQIVYDDLSMEAATFQRGDVLIP